MHGVMIMRRSPRWTRATYKAHAEAIRRSTTSENREAMKLIAEEFAVLYKNDNQLFDRAKFLTACGVKQ